MATPGCGTILTLLTFSSVFGTLLGCLCPPKHDLKERFCEQDIGKFKKNTKAIFVSLFTVTHMNPHAPHFMQFHPSSIKPAGGATKQTRRRNYQ